MSLNVRMQVLTAPNMNFIIVRDIGPCNLAETD
jgi:hypothetical protein